MAKSATRTIVEYCPNCDTAIRFKKRPFRGQIITCPECSDVLEVVSETPLELDWAYVEDDDDDWRNTDADDDENDNYDDYDDYNEDDA